MAETLYLDYEGLSLYDLSIKNWNIEKNKEIEIKLTDGKSDNGTVLITPGKTTPATYYTAEEAVTYNIEHNLRPGDSTYKYEGDLKDKKVITNTNIEVNIDGETLVLDSDTKQIKVASSALTQYIGDKDSEEKYAINVGTADQSNNKKISLDINSESNAIEKTASGIKINLEIHPFTAPEIFGTNVKEAYALIANGTTLTGLNNEQVIKIYKDSALLDMKLLHSVPATYYTAEEALEYNTEYSLQPGSIGYKRAGDVKTEAIKPTYNKTNGWTNISSELRTEANLALCFAYENVNEVIIVEAIQIGNFLRESEFKSGLQVENGEVSVKLDSNSENFLSVSAGGIKIAGIQNAINNASANAKTTITEVAADDTIPSSGSAKIIITKSTQNDGHYNYTITGQDLASAVAAAAEILRAQTAEQAIDSVVGLDKASNSETRTYINIGHYIGQLSSNTVKTDIKTLDTKLKTVSDKVDDVFEILKNAGISSNEASIKYIMETTEDGFFIVDEGLNVGVKVDNNGIHAKNISF